MVVEPVRIPATGDVDSPDCLGYVGPKEASAARLKSLHRLRRSGAGTEHDHHGPVVWGRQRCEGACDEDRQGQSGRSLGTRRPAPPLPFPRK